MFTRTRKITPTKTTELQEAAALPQNILDYTDADRINALNKLKQSLINYFEPTIDLLSFRYFYITSGITDGLNYIYNQSNSSYSMADGEYEYLKYLGDHKNIEKIHYVSNPSAIDGNFVSNWDYILNSNNKIILDCAYLGTTNINRISINKNVDTVLLGLSKTFGLYENRIGFIFTNTKNHLLHGIVYDNCYFNLQACLLSIELLNKFPLGYMHNKYYEQQIEICNRYSLIPSDICFIGTTNVKEYTFFKRGNVNRLCLTEKFKRL